jgi:hypothetical protein
MHKYINCRLTPDVAGQYKAWCRNDGDHKTRARKANWNSELIKKMRAEMGFRWEACKQKIPTLFADLLQSIKAIFLKLQSEMRSKLNRLILVMDSIY